MSKRVAKMELTGRSAILMHRFPLEPVKAIEKKSVANQAEISAYRIPEGQPNAGNLYVPAVAVQRTFINGAAFSKGKGRSSLQKTAAACMMVTPEYLDLKTKTYVIDSRPIVNPTTKGRIIRHRPRLDEWKIELELEFDPTLLSDEQVRTIVDDSCSRVGFLDFRPACKGPFGRADVTSWEIVEIDT